MIKTRNGNVIFCYILHEQQNSLEYGSGKSLSENKYVQMKTHLAITVHITKKYHACVNIALILLMRFDALKYVYSITVISTFAVVT